MGRRRLASSRNCRAQPVPEQLQTLNRNPYVRRPASGCRADCARPQQDRAPPSTEAHTCRTGRGASVRSYPAGRMSDRDPKCRRWRRAGARRTAARERTALLDHPRDRRKEETVLDRVQGCSLSPGFVAAAKRRQRLVDRRGHRRQGYDGHTIAMFSLIRDAQLSV